MTPSLKFSDTVSTTARTISGFVQMGGVATDNHCHF